MNEKVYKFEYDGNVKMFAYDEANATLYYVYEMADEDREYNLRWAKNHKKPLFDTIDDKYAIITNIGFNKHHWNDKEVRDEYLSEYCMELDDEMESMDKMFYI